MDATWGFALQGLHGSMIEPPHPLDVILQQSGPEASDVFEVMKSFLVNESVSKSLQDSEVTYLFTS